MTPQQINIAIAEHLGWKFKGDPELDEYTKGWVKPEAWAAPPGTSSLDWMRNELSDEGRLVFVHSIPDHHGDLNAMHKVLVEHVPDDQWDDYLDAMDEFIPIGLRPQARRKWAMIASAAVLAKAFLKWKEPA